MHTAISLGVMRKALFVMALVLGAGIGAAVVELHTGLYSDLLADGEIALSEELVEYRLKPFEKVRPWTAGTGYAVADFLAARGLPVSYIDIRTGEPAEPPPRQWQPTRLVTIAE